MTAYYNEFDPKAAAWLRELIKAGHIAAGDVDERSIVDIRPSDLIGYTQCHFFAGIGVWSYALRRAGWPDDRPVWTGSCPCQPFSAAGKGAGFTDERHLWPHFHWLIENCRPPIVFGEQVASKDGLGWLDLVQADLEGSGYASGAVDTCAAGFGAPHIRQRLYWVANADNAGSQGWFGMPERAVERIVRASGLADGLADSAGVGRVGRRAGGEGHEPGEIERSERLCDAGGLADPGSERRQQNAGSPSGDENQNGPTRRDRSEPDCDHVTSGYVEDSHSIPTNGHWSDADWLFCRDGKWRPVEPGTFPLAHGAATRVGRLRGYGNAIVAPAAQAFIEAYLETELVAANDNYLSRPDVALLAS
ncbi:DNA cytosine methyltransferase [Brucella intermedia]|uniref:DNA cytosine methyltransferase n=1 Tax=Brucella intermedia TaxID=94625 RepID=UPI00124D6D8C|nr:DNA cytosine methyltransferase [Brucella intermedia]KAB2716650.1 DNA cytosine methyltransferase [Brucella intermedia]